MMDLKTTRPLPNKFFGEIIGKVLEPSNPQAALFIYLIIWTLLRLLLASSIELSVDESYYWNWARVIDWGYFDHPPLVAWLARISQELFGLSSFGTRAIFVLSGILFQYCLFLFLKELIEKSLVAYQSVLILSSTPLFLFIFSFAVLPDSALLLPWLLSMLFLLRFLKRGNLVWIILWGLFVGLAMLAKVTAVTLFLSSFLVFCFVERKNLKFRKVLQVLSAVIVAVAIFSPYLYWNADHNWPSFAFMAKRISGGTRFQPFYAMAIQFGQALFVGPLLYYFLWQGVWKKRKKIFNDLKKGELIPTFLLSFFLVSQFGFSFLAIFKKVLPHWMGVSFIAGVPLLLWLWNDPSIREERCPKTRSKTQKLLLSFWGQNLLVFFLILTPAMSIVLQPFRDGGSFETKKVTLHPLGDAWGFEEVAIFADALRKSHLSQEKTPLLTYHWANAGRLNLGFRDPYQVVAVGKKANQYSLWTDESSLLGKDYILVRDRMFRQKFERSFDCRVLQELPSFWVELYDYKIRRWDFVLCQNLRQIRRH